MCAQNSDSKSIPSIAGSLASQDSPMTVLYLDRKAQVAEFHRQRKARREAAQCQLEAIRNVMGRVLNRVLEPNHGVENLPVGTRSGLHAFDMRLNPQVEQNFLESQKERTKKDPSSSKTLTPTSERSMTKTRTPRLKTERLMSQGSYASIASTIRSIDSEGSKLLEVPIVEGPPSPGRREFSKRLTFTLQNTMNVKEDGPIEIPWLNDRLATSCRSCRFELPMDMKSLESMTVQDYLLGFCVIPRHRTSLYQKMYNKQKNKTTGILQFKDMEACVMRVLVDTVEMEDIRKLFQALKLTNTTKITPRLFAVICAVAERILYLSYVGRHGQVGIGRGFLECADFSALKWKLKDVNVDPYLKRLLLSLG